MIWLENEIISKQSLMIELPWNFFYIIFVVPLVLEMCTTVIEEHGIVDGIYRLSGITSNMQKLRYLKKYSLATIRQEILKQ